MYKPKICPICGDEFLPSTAKQKYCKKEVTKKCPICGAYFSTTCSPDGVETCAMSECRNAYKRSSFTSVTKKCRVCGRDFYPSSPRQNDCGRPIDCQCIVCGAQFQGICSRNHANNTCSKQCSNILASSRRQDAWASGSRKCALCGELFSPVNNTQKICKRTHTRKCEVCGKEFNLIVPASHYIHDIAKTCSLECKGKLSNLNIDPNKRAEALHMKYMNRYNGNSELAAEYDRFVNSTREYISETFSSRPTLRDISTRLNVAECTVGQIIIHAQCTDLIRYKISTMEQEVTEYIRSILPTAKIENNTKRVITPYQIDIYLPEYKLGIECNPTCTHNSSVPMISGDPIPPSYHRMKTDMCQEAGIFLLHIFGYEWTYRKDIIKSIIRNALKANTCKIYARRCEIREVSPSDCNYFLENNHRQGAVGSKVRLGLYYDDELVSLMTFGSIRNTIGTGSKEDLSECWELIRFCSKLNTTVVGGASKLFNHFVQSFHPSQIRSFSDRAHTSGGVYQSLGFRELRQSSEGYVWVNLANDKHYHRTSTQKYKLAKLLKDPNIDISRTEKQIMEEHGFVQVFDSGTITWEWSCSEYTQ